jgi:2',3'-cyclic-nucleotide 2'-phosphodiesterase (5'-nucleotidase family)
MRRGALLACLSGGAATLALALLLVSDFHSAGASQAPSAAAPRETEAQSHSPDVRFAVIGDNGTGDREEYEVATQMMKSRETFPFDFVLMLGDNLYGGNSPGDYTKKFEQPYKPLLDAGIKFYASLGNHDNSNERFYKPFNMGEQRYYVFAKGNVSFFALDSNYMNPEQLAWLEAQLKASTSDWKICYFHHPLYSDGKFHGPDPDLRARIEPLFIKYGVNVVLSGHEHVYEQIRPQHGIYYFIEGSSGQLRPHNLRPSPQTMQGFDTDRAFLLVAISGDQFRFQTISRKGDVVDSGTLLNR